MRPRRASSATTSARATRCGASWSPGPRCSLACAPPERKLTEQLLDQPLWLEVDAELADHAGKLARTHRRSHPGIGLADYLIAAGVERLGARLLTRNVKHFPMLPDLEPAY